ncbi:hypothetical protein D3C71_1518470 [compost metagenome]
MPEPRRHAVAQRLSVAQHSAQEDRIGFLRARHHQVRLQLLVGFLGTLSPLLAARWQADQRVELALQIGRRRVTDQTVVGLDIARPQGIEQVLVLVQAETLIPGRAVCGAVIQTCQFAHQIIEGTQLFVAIARLLQCRQRGLHVGDLHPVADKRQQQSRPP